MKFNLICIDPPWSFGDKLSRMKRTTKRSSQAQYHTLTTNEIKQIDVPAIADDWCVLAMWVPSSMLANGLDIMQHWCFDFKQTFVWVKTKKKADIKDLNSCTRVGMGRLFRQSHELVLLGTKGKVYEHLYNKSQRSVCFDRNLVHSAKPELLQDRFELMFPTANKLEMFARRLKSNWTCIGDAVTGVDINLSVSNLILL